MIENIDNFLYNAKNMDVEEYFNYCDKIIEIDNINKLKIICLKDFYYPHFYKIVNKHLLGLQKFGLCIETYDIFAVNRETKTLWAIYLERYPDISKYSPIISDNKIYKLLQECKKIFPEIKN
jgi:hypothetical protein